MTFILIYHLYVDMCKVVRLLISPVIDRRLNMMCFY